MVRGRVIKQCSCAVLLAVAIALLTARADANEGEARSQNVSVWLLFGDYKDPFDNKHHCSKAGEGGIS